MKSVGLDMLGVGLTLAVLLMSINQALCASSCERAANSSKDSRVWWVPRATSCMLSVQCGQGPPLSHLTGVEKLVFVFRWDPKTKRCTPDLCDGVKLADIPDASGYLPSALACQVHSSSRWAVMKLNVASSTYTSGAGG